MTTQYLLLLYSLLFNTVSTTYATQVMRRPEGYNGTVNTFPTAENSTSHDLQKRATSKVSFAYFTNWGIYKANFHPNDIVPAPLTHILYAFADTDASTGAIKLTDSYADESKHYPGDSWSAGGNNLYGCLKQLYLLKLKQRNLKVLLSIGGWTYSQNGHFNFITNPSSRATFVANAVRLIEDYGFDGIDIDYEYPSNSAQGQGLADLLTELRKAFNTLKEKKNDSTPYLITVAVAAGPKHYAYYKVPQMNSAVDYWNLMAYDYAGSWITWADNAANVYGGKLTGFQTDSALNWYVAHGASSNKITLGMPLYGRAFENTEGLEKPYHGVGPGTVEPGVYAYKNLPFAGAEVSENEYYLSSYSYDPVKKELVSYDTPHIVSQKVQYLFSKGLAGSMFWELSTDKVGSDSLVGTAARTLGTLEQTPNHIHYPNSKWDNVKDNMGQKVTNSPQTTTSHTLSNPSKPSPKPAPSPKSQGLCTGVAAWSSAIAYTGGAKVTHDNHLWVAKWWTQASAPEGQTGCWTDKGKC